MKVIEFPRPINRKAVEAYTGRLNAQNEIVEQLLAQAEHYNTAMLYEMQRYLYILQCFADEVPIETFREFITKHKTAHNLNITIEDDLSFQYQLWNPEELQECYKNG